MARLINSPGVQITEKDLTLRTSPSTEGTVVVVPGFASQGPVSEPMKITTVSELEEIYGTPTSPAERYFFASCKEVLASPGTLNTVRLPYGPDLGESFSKGYSGLFYPMLSTSDTPLLSANWLIGPPLHVLLNPQQYKSIIDGDFNWTGTYDNTIGVGVSSSAFFGINNNITAGFIILNDLQVVNNENAEGYYVGLTDNTQFSPGLSPNFYSVTRLYALSSDTNLAIVDDIRIDFALSATALESERGITSVSEMLETVGFVGFERQDYDDHMSLGVFKIRRSTADSTILSMGATERYIGSFDYTRKRISPSGGMLVNSFIEDEVNDGSPSVRMIINPNISTQFDWAKNSTAPTSRITVLREAHALFPMGIYVPDSKEAALSKIIGNVPGKLSKTLKLLEVVENSTIDVVCDSGLSTIYAATEEFFSVAYNDEDNIPMSVSLINNWRAVVNELLDFTENVRKDCFAIIDPLRSNFVVGKNTKVIESSNHTFTNDIFGPLKECVRGLETNYGAIYANWIRISDTYSTRKLWAPISGYAAAVFAKSDKIAQPWAAPAGLNRGIFDVMDIAFNPNQKQRDKLYEISTNPVVYFLNDGFALMGQKTLQSKPTAFDRINVRRLFLTLERAVTKTVKYFVFEPNTEFTRTRLINAITPIFERVKNTQGVYDYLLVCDERNNTSETIDNNELIVDIYIKPTRTVEFILVNFVATRTGQEFQELI